MASLVERGTEASLPFSPEKKIHKDKLPLETQGLQFRLSKVIIGMKEFQEAYRNQTENLDWTVEFEANEDSYKVRSVLVTAPDSLIERRLEVKRIQSITGKKLDVDGKVLSNPGPFIEEETALVWSKENSSISYSKKRSDKLSPEKQYKDSEEAKVEVIKFANMIELLTKEVQANKIEKPKQKPGLIQPAKTDTHLGKEAVTWPKRNRFLEEVQIFIGNPAYRARVLRKRQEKVESQINYLRYRFSPKKA